jgi:hypothetical protein
MMFQIGLDYLDSEIGYESNTRISSDGNFSDIHNQLDTMISCERERAFFRSRDVRFFKKMSLQNILLMVACLYE